MLVVAEGFVYVEVYLVRLVCISNGTISLV